MQIIIVAMGSFLEVVSIVMIAISMLIPVINRLGFDPVWVGAMTPFNIKCVFITPPFGMNQFVMKGVAPSNTTMEDVCLAAAYGRGQLPDDSAHNRLSFRRRPAGETEGMTSREMEI